MLVIFSVTIFDNKLEFKASLSFFFLNPHIMGCVWGLLFSFSSFGCSRSWGPGDE